MFIYNKNDIFRKTYVEINLDHFQHNINLLRNSLPKDTFFCPMVKANAYGHGDIALTRVLEHMGVKHVGVCLIEEALRLRKAGIEIDILVFRGFDKKGAKKIIENKLTPVIGTWEQLESIIEFADASYPIHLKINTGMNRLGFSVNETEKVFERIKNEKKIKLEGVLTHFYEGEDADLLSGNSAKQLEQFLSSTEVFSSLNPYYHILNSSGAIHRISDKAQHNFFKVKNLGARPGIACYGHNPVFPKVNLDLRTVMTLKSFVSVTHDLKKGEGVSYNATWRATRDSRVAVVPIGYADGYHRILGNRADAIYKGQRVLIIGNVCMDFLMLDITDVKENNNKNDEVILFGKDLSVAELAKLADTIPWELMTSVSERVPRKYIGELAHFVGDAL